MTPPAWLRHQGERPVLPGELVALAFVRFDADHFHAGVLYADLDERHHLLHLAFHHRLERTTGFAEYVFVVPALDPEVAKNIAAMCERVWKVHQQIGVPYGLRYSGGTFDTQGKLQLASDEVGLTCSTFPLAVFAAAGFRLVDPASWPEREDDHRKQEELLALLQKHGASDEHVSQARQQVGSKRIRPEEVAGAGSAATFPCTFAVAGLAGEHIRRTLEA